MYDNPTQHQPEVLQTWSRQLCTLIHLNLDTSPLEYVNILLFVYIRMVPVIKFKIQAGAE